ncbi:bucentaur or craniofacial development-domain-containing protein [Syncephalis plumigaleata]|nr:bucentaur or craniofacial development-domain-containing protein [Syncephalis plumigaleata]
MSTHSIIELNNESDSNDSDYKPGANLSSDEDSDNDFVESDHNTETIEATEERRERVEEAWTTMKADSNKVNKSTLESITSVEIATTTNDDSKEQHQEQASVSDKQVAVATATSDEQQPQQQQPSLPPLKSRRRKNREDIFASYLGKSEIASQVRVKKARTPNTLEQSKNDWDSFVHREGIRDDLTFINKDGFLEKQAFLERASDRGSESIKSMKKTTRRRY